MTSTRVLPVAILVAAIAACAHSGGPATARANADRMPPPDGSLEQILAGKVSGAIVSRGAHGGISVRISGPKTFYGSSEPLYIVDDVPVEAGPGGNLSWLNPHDIASIAVLKYEASTAIYGVRGSNGVIIIRTTGSH